MRRVIGVTVFYFGHAQNACRAMATITKVPQGQLFVSEPDPSMFGNGANTPHAVGWSNKNWLKSRFHFNFAEYNNGPNNFGVLRVMNDDLVQPARGFGAHPHREMEWHHCGTMEP